MSEMSEHRVPMLGASWRRLEDPAHSRDPRVRALVAALATLPAPEPRPEFRAELRAQLVAIAPRIITESAGDTTPMVEIVPAKTMTKTETETHSQPAVAARPRHADSVFARFRGLSLGRPLAIVASVVTVFALLLGGAVWISKNSLPGDTLYGLKRASENAQLALDGNATSKARDYLHFAKTRVDEARGLLSRASGSAAGAGPQASGFDAHTVDLINTTLASADSDVRSASTLLGSTAVKNASANPLLVMTAWAPDQLARLRTLAAAMPAGPLRARTASSEHLVSAALTRAQQLAPKVRSRCIDPAMTDELGPLPVSTCTPSTPTGPRRTTGSPTPSRTGNSAVTGGSVHANTGSVVPVPSGSTGPQAPGSSSSTGGLPIPSVPLPSLPSSIPVTVNTCGLGLSLGPIGVGIGTCSGVHISVHP
jgi:hypothetical protein